MSCIRFTEWQGLTWITAFILTHVTYRIKLNERTKREIERWIYNFHLIYMYIFKHLELKAKCYIRTLNGKKMTIKYLLNRVCEWIIQTVGSTDSLNSPVQKNDSFSLTLLLLSWTAFMEHFSNFLHISSTEERMTYVFGTRCLVSKLWQKYALQNN